MERCSENWTLVSLAGTQRACNYVVGNRFTEMVKDHHIRTRYPELGKRKGGGQKVES